MIFRLHSRLVLWNLLIIGLIAGVLGFFVSNSLRDHIVSEIEEQLTQETSLVAAYSLDAESGDSPDAKADRIGRMLGVRVTLIAPDGHVEGDSELDGEELRTVENHLGRPEVQAALKGDVGTAIRWSSTVRTEFIYVARRADPYIVRLAKPLSASDDLIADLRYRLLLSLLIAVAVTLGFGYLAHGLISRPLREISRISRKLASGDLRQRLPISGDEEIAALGNSLNTMARNLSDRMEELTEGKQRLELIVGAMSQGVIVLGGNGQISLANRAVRGMLENDRDPIGKTLLEVFRKPELENAVRSVLAGGYSEVIEMTTWNTRVVQANVAPVTNASGVIDSVVVVFHDLTDIRRTERMRRDFVANVSHEFKTPLTSIRGYAETLLSGALDDRQISTEFLRIIERNAQHLETLVSDLLVLARLEADIPVSMDPVNIRSIVEEQLASRRSVFAERGVSVINECPEMELHADRLRLSTAISNLIDNAVYYNKPNGEVRVTGGMEEDMFKLAIADTGQGIPADELLRVFERFYRVDKARSRESGGTGLGLSIVKHAIESQGGSIMVSSRIGVGSTFTIKLPASNAVLPAQPELFTTTPHS
jgi:two-component system, OmpR family, phosphate regulon sensor histidine kinase PhoR